MIKKSMVHLHSFFFVLIHTIGRITIQNPNLIMCLYKTHQRISEVHKIESMLLTVA